MVALALFATVALGTLPGLVAPERAAASTVPTFTFTGTGYGHGLGMSQLGAVEAAKQGLSAEQIVKHYYTGVALTTLGTYRAEVNLWPSATSTNKAKTSWTLMPGYAGGTLRVQGLVNGVATDWVTYPDGAYTFKAAAGKVTMYYTAAGVAKSVALGTQVTVTSPKPSGIASAQPDLIQVVDQSGGLSKANTRYRGFMVLTSPSAEPTEVRLQNRVDVEPYLYGVVPRELGSTFSPLAAASQAQAIVARSYAYPATSELYCTTSSQVYGGHSYFTSTANRTAGISSLLEQPGATSAVDATKGIHVTYAGDVVKTYFSGSNGVATASNEDVWGGSPLPYLRSVTDPYFVSNSSTSWTTVYTGLTLGERLAGRGYGPSGAGSTVWVDDVELTYGDGGYATTAVVSWSNGSISTMTLADNIRIIFGLKSAQTQVENSNELVKYEENALPITLAGGWTRSVIAGNSGGAIATSKTLNAYFGAKFTGEGIRWIGPRASSYGQAKVYLDGELVTTVNAYAAATSRQQVLYSVGGLDPDVTHSLKVVVTTKANSTATGYVGLDRLDVVNGTLVVPTYLDIQDDSPTIVKSGTWTTYRHSLMLGGSVAYSATLNKGFTAKFTGSELRYYGWASSVGGRAKIYIDGIYQKTVSFYASTSTPKKLIYFCSGLDPSKTHTIQVVITTKAGSTAAGRVSVDLLRVTQPVAP